MLCPETFVFSIRVSPSTLISCVAYVLFNLWLKTQHQSYSNILMIFLNAYKLMTEVYHLQKTILDIRLLCYICANLWVFRHFRAGVYNWLSICSTPVSPAIVGSHMTMGNSKTVRVMIIVY